jgi:hypothetical protein
MHMHREQPVALNMSDHLAVPLLATLSQPTFGHVCRCGQSSVIAFHSYLLHGMLLMPKSCTGMHVVPNACTEEPKPWVQALGWRAGRCLRVFLMMCTLSQNLWAL